MRNTSTGTALVSQPKRQDEDAEQRPLSLEVLRRLVGYSAAHAKKSNLLMLFVLLRAIQYPAFGWATAAMISGPIAARDVRGIWLGGSLFAALVLSSVVVFHYRI